MEEYGVAATNALECTRAGRCQNSPLCAQRAVLSSQLEATRRIAHCSCQTRFNKAATSISRLIDPSDGAGAISCGSFTGAPRPRQAHRCLMLLRGCLKCLRGQAAADRVSDVRGRGRRIVPETAQPADQAPEAGSEHPQSLGLLCSPHTFKRRRKFENSQPPSLLFPLLLCLTPHPTAYSLLPSPPFPTHAILMFPASPPRPSPNLPDWPSSVAGEGRQLRRQPEASTSSSSSGTWTRKRERESTTHRRRGSKTRWCTRCRSTPAPDRDTPQPIRRFSHPPLAVARSHHRRSRRNTLPAFRSP